MTGPILEAIGSGSLVGFTLGLIGGGGSILATPLLLYVVGVSSPHVAIGTGALAVSVNAYANLLGQHFIRVNTIHPTGVVSGMTMNPAMEQMFAAVPQSWG